MKYKTWEEVQKRLTEMKNQVVKAVAEQKGWDCEVRRQELSDRYAFPGKGVEYTVIISTARTTHRLDVTSRDGDYHNTMTPRVKFKKYQANKQVMSGDVGKKMVAHIREVERAERKRDREWNEERKTKEACEDRIEKDFPGYDGFGFYKGIVGLKSEVPGEYSIDELSLRTLSAADVKAIVKFLKRYEDKD